MTLPTTDTIVTYPAGATSGTATVLHVEPVDAGFAVLLDRTPVHPVDAGWPDQAADRAVIRWEGGEASVSDAIVAATDSAALHFGGDIPVRKGTEGWAFVVAHLVPDAPVEGTEVTVEVDGDYRRALSVGHTGCHLASLALNRAMTDRWRKEVRPDALGAPNFDAEANETSTIVPHGSVDTYRLGKALRKRGFTTDGLADDLPAIQDAVNAALAGWIATAAPIRIDRDGEHLTDRRSWVAELVDGEASIPCGGTHATSLAELEGLRATLTLDEVEGGLQLTMTTVI
ncbi:metal-dependent hydrolase [Cryobacterium sp. BB736]|uniref:metal-dependent hydrolase n=1 Tax=Cryobacterium sp. BB736 TaxID=2746963 RepID=UPI001876D462|nr:metal-dependent hydrolase [Cryobacterium sp. BB736]